METQNEKNVKLLEECRDKLLAIEKQKSAEIYNMLREKYDNIIEEYKKKLPREKLQR